MCYFPWVSLEEWASAKARVLAFFEVHATMNAHAHDGTLGQITDDDADDVDGWYGADDGGGSFASGGLCVRLRGVRGSGDGYRIEPLRTDRWRCPVLVG
jgi:hypothetical protein